MSSAPPKDVPPAAPPAGARFILASASPRRRELLRAAGFDFDVRVSGVDETIEEDWRRLPGALSPGERIALELAARKARAVAAAHPADTVLGADTVVVTADGELLGTPGDRTQARRMIGLLNGRPHRVHTGVALIAPGGQSHRVATAIVRFRDLTMDEIEDYVETGEGDDKAGAYGYQGIGRRLVASVEGDPETVIGLPTRLVREMLAELGSRDGFRSALRMLLLGAAVLLSLMGPVLAEEWVEYRYAAPPVGLPFVLMVNGSAVLTGGDTSIVRGFDGQWLEILVRDTVPRRLLFHRPTEGVLEYVIEPTISTAPAVSPLARPTLARPTIAPRELVPMHPAGSSPGLAGAASWPPILVPPPTTVLVTPPGVSAPSPVRGYPVVPPAAPPSFPVSPVLSSAPVAEPATPIVTPSGGSVATERPAPLGRDLAPDTAIDRFGVTKPGEVAHFTLSQELLDRALYSDAIAQFLEFVARYPKSSMKEAAMMRIGRGYHLRGEEHERESLRQKDLRRSGAANEEIDAAIADFSAATDAFRVVQNAFPNSNNAAENQLAIAAALHGRIRARFMKGGPPVDEPQVVVEYLRVGSGYEDSGPLSAARLGIAQYYRDLGDARLASRTDRVLMLEAYNRAVKEYREIVATFPSAPATEEALIDLARLFDRNLEMRRFDEAVRHYDLLASRFPTSRFAEEARARSLWIKENYL